MKNRTSISLILITLLFGLCACTEDSDKSATDELLAGTGISTEDFGDLVTEIDASTVEGSWHRVNELGTTIWEFNSDGTGQHVYPEDEPITRDIEWALEGGILTSKTIDGTIDQAGCQFESVYSSASAVVDDRLYMGVWLRTTGSGDSADGTWENLEAETEIRDCDNSTMTSYSLKQQRLEISEESFAWSGAWETRDASEYGVENDLSSDQGNEVSEGTIEFDGDWLALFNDTDMDSPQILLLRFSENAMIEVFPDQYDSPEAALAAVGFENNNRRLGADTQKELL